MPRCFARLRQPTGIGVFGQPLGVLLQRDGSDVPLVLSRLVGEIERRGLDTPGLYYCWLFEWFSRKDHLVCGANERKEHLRAQFIENIREADISERPVPDINLLTCLLKVRNLFILFFILKDFLRELPEPLVPTNIYTMLMDAAGVMPPNDREGNQKLVMRIVDCLPTANKVVNVEFLHQLYF